MHKDSIAAVREAGVVGAGGAGFPTHVKLAGHADTVVVNAAECEPLIHVDIYLLEARAAEVMAGLVAVMAATGAKKAIIGLKEKYRDREKAIKSALKTAGLSRRAEIAFLPNAYPMGDEHVLVCEATGRTVPPGGIPLTVGVVVINVETLLNVARALSGAPVISKFVTVNGDVASPYTTEVPVGMPIDQLLEAGGARLGPDSAVLDGGPMMGRLVGTDAVVTKTTKALLVFPRDHAVVRSRVQTVASQVRVAEEICCQCRNCTDVCPRYLLGHDLEPHRYMRAIARVKDLEAGKELLPREVALLSGALLCTECGACEVMGCRMGLSPRILNQAVKGALMRKGIRYKAPGDGAQPRPNRRESAISSHRLLLRADLVGYDLEAPFRTWAQSCTAVRLPLLQHIGAPGLPVVEEGQVVTAGQLLAEIPDGKLGARSHASIPGRVTLADGCIHINV